MEDFQTGAIDLGPWKSLAWIGMAPRAFEHRRTVPDMYNAHASVSLFFESHFFELRPDLKDSLLLDQEKRAKQIPDRRCFNSNKTMPKEFWNEWDKIYAADRPNQGDIKAYLEPSVEW